MEKLIESSPAAEWVEPYEGLEYSDGDIVVQSAKQTLYLTTCGIDPLIFGKFADPSVFIGLAIRAGVSNGISSNGSVNMVQSIVQHKPVLLDTAVRVRGRVVAVEEVPRGQAVTSEVWFLDGNGNRLVSTRRISLRPDKRKRNSRGAGARPSSNVGDIAEMQRIGKVKFTPDMVTSYNSQKTSQNRIHFDPKSAQSAGFRAPIIGGGMGVHFLISEIWRKFRPVEFDVAIVFRRPIFWDDQCELAVQEDAAVWKSICLVKDGKVATELTINQLRKGR